MSCSFEIGAQCGEAEEGGCNVWFGWKLFSGCTPDTPQSLALPSSSAPLIFSALVFCYVTVVIGCARGHAGGTGNGTSRRSEAREGMSRVKRHRFMLLQQVLTEVPYFTRRLIYPYACSLPSVSVYLSLFPIFVLFLWASPRNMKNNGRKKCSV